MAAGPQRREPGGSARPVEGVRDLPLAAGAFVGMLVYVLGYLVTYVATNSAIRNGALGPISGNEVWRGVGWLFYNAHYVDTVGSLSVFSITFGTGAANFITESGAFATWLFFVPPVLLLGAGAIVGYQSARDASPQFAAKTGLTVVPGYLALSVVGAFLFRMTSGNSVVGPEPVTAAFLAGLVYPLVLCVVGSVLVSVVASAGSD
ncbi:MAG: transporter [Halobacteriaceae archaeon]